MAQRNAKGPEAEPVHGLVQASLLWCLGMVCCVDIPLRFWLLAFCNNPQ